jgi:aspartate/methionine/tyrosine aminotransferase
MAIPEIYASPKFIPHLNERNHKYKERAHKAVSILSNTKGIRVVEPKGGFFLTVLFEDGILNDKMNLPISNQAARDYIQPMLKNIANDRRFVLNLLASTGICVVPISSFCCSKDGFRVTLLEEDPVKFEWVFTTIRDSIKSYLG